jgi:hypothetical protein
MSKFAIFSAKSLTVVTQLHFAEQMTRVKPSVSLTVLQLANQLHLNQTMIACLLESFQT